MFGSDHLPGLKKKESYFKAGVAAASSLSRLLQADATKTSDNNNN